MRNAKWVATLAFCLMSPAGHAEDPVEAVIEVAEISNQTLFFESLPDEFQYSTDWVPSQTGARWDGSEDWDAMMEQLNFVDANVINRILELRALSLLQLGEIQEAPLFLGVNDDGYVGLHFNTAMPDGDLSNDEIVRIRDMRDAEGQ